MTFYDRIGLALALLGAALALFDCHIVMAVACVALYVYQIVRAAKMPV